MTEPALDTAFLERQVFGDRVLERELLGLFAAQCRRLGPILASVDPGSVRADAAHTLCGAARAIGARRVAEVALACESALGQGPAAAEAILPALDAAIAAAQEAIAVRLREG